MLGTLVVEIHAGRKLRETQTWSNQDPYVKGSVQRGALWLRTKCCADGGTSPNFSSVHANILTFDVDDTSSAKLELEVWNENTMLDDDFIGSTEIDLSSIQGILPKKQVSLNTGGYLLLSFRFTPLSEAEAKTKYSNSAGSMHRNQKLRNAERTRKDEETLNVEILSASDLTSVTALTDQDPYVLATVLPHQKISKRTNTCEAGGTDPEWSHEHRNLLMLRIDEGSTSLQLDVMSQSTIGDDVLIGTADLQLEDIPYLQNLPKARQLRGGGKLLFNVYRKKNKKRIVEDLLSVVSSKNTDTTLVYRALSDIAGLAKLEDLSLTMLKEHSIVKALSPFINHSCEPELQLGVALLFANLSEHDSCPELLVNNGILESVVEVLNALQCNVKVQLDTVRHWLMMIMNLASDEDTAPAMLTAGVCKVLLKLIKVDEALVCRTLASLSFHPDTPKGMVQMGVGGALRTLLQSDSQDIRAYCAEVFVNLSAHGETPPLLLDEVPMMLSRLVEPAETSEIKADVAQAIANISFHHDTKIRLLSYGVSSAVSSVLQSPSLELRPICVEILMYMSTNPQCAEQLLHEQVVAVLEPFLRIQQAVVDEGSDTHGDEEDEKSSTLADLKSNCARTMINVLQPLVLSPSTKAEETQ